MEMAAGNFSLLPIFDFAAHNPMMPHQGSGAVQSAYSKLLNRTIANVPELPGWYLWGKFNDDGSWNIIYLGKSEKRKTSSLHTRMYDQLREKFCPTIWAELYGSEPVLRQSHDAYPHGRYDGGVRKSVGMIGVRFVIWVGVADDISEEVIMRQEMALIKVWESSHNDVRRWRGDASPDALTEEISKIVEDELSRMSKPLYSLPEIEPSTPEMKVSAAHSSEKQPPRDDPFRSNEPQSD
jgi:hypothetical protein